MKQLGRFGMIAGVLLAVGCTTQVDQVIANGERTRELVCGACAESYGFASSDACHTVYDSIERDEAEVRCLEDAVARNESLRRYFDCTLQAQGQALSCVEAANETCSASTFEGCQSEIATQLEVCGGTHLTDVASEELYDCFD